MVGSQKFRIFKNFLSSLSPCCQSINVSSKYLHQTRGKMSQTPKKSFLVIDPKNDNIWWVHFCTNRSTSQLLIKWKIVFKNDISQNIFCYLNERVIGKSKDFLIAINYSSCGVLGYILGPATSIVHNVISSDRGGRLVNLHKKSFVPIM